MIKLQAFAPTTLKTRRSQWNRYHAFCKDFSLQAIPVTPQTVCRFLVSVGDNLSYTTINNYVSALNSLGKHFDGSFDLRLDYGVSLLLRGFKRLKGDETHKKDPLLPSDLRALAAVVNLDDTSEFTVWLIVLLAFRTLLRKSHFVSAGVDEQEHLLRLQDISEEPWGYKLTIRSSKTIQFSQWVLEIPVSYSRPPLCAASVLKQYLSRFPRHDSEFLFTLNQSNIPRQVPYSRALSLLKTWCLRRGIHKNIGFHSLRRGAASYMHSLDIELISIQKAGDWQSLCVLSYLTVDFDQKRKVETLVSSSLYFHRPVYGI